MRAAVLALVLLSFVPIVRAAEKLPTVEVPASASVREARFADTFVVLISGDGGWAAIDKAVAKALATDGMPVVGLNALQYFWTKRTPAVTARDVESLIAKYAAKWQKSRVVLAGYSRGADVLPFVVNRLSPAARAKVRLVALFAPARKAEFEFHMTDWLHDSGSGLAIAPEAASISAPLLCVAGEDDRDTLCRELHPASARVVMLQGAHHFDGNYDQLAQRLEEALR